MIFRRNVTAALVAASLAVSVAFAGEPVRPSRESVVSDSEARAMLAAKVKQAQARDVAAYCADVQLFDMCERQWAKVGGAKAIPSQPPTIVRSVAYGEFRALRACGTRPDGTPYEADFVVRSQEGVAVVHLAIWWGDQTYSGFYAEGSEPTLSVGRPPLC
ncbi:MAG TPA: hypothetical protein VNQ77_00980 [Frankiaceae bacterium]|nr:hypothetical protein [Frankiaceae bacterium]